MKYFAVIGNPIAHSRSPEIHDAFAKALGLTINYQRLLSEPAQFTQTVNAFFHRTDVGVEHARTECAEARNPIAGHGMNVTVPFKEAALQYADELSEAAQIAGAVNTLTNQSGKIKGDNTDGIGLVTDILTNHQWPIADKRVLMVGAGGAARGCLLPILKQQPQQLTITNRSVDKAQSLAEGFQKYGNIDYADYTDYATTDTLNRPYDIVINATAASLHGQMIALPAEIFSADTLAYDMMYAKKPTPFMTFAQQHRATAVDGLGMLVEQAAQAFYLWHGEHPETATVIQRIRQSL
ncbi:shikimate dehydrogenase [Ostreibacterium oceani]|uniref:Shikimate dehydrogenase (NADP(+)) n=1 Tax=Ostreibacterium oceani TaxID=2654998 RepID=A0A6N7EZT8_9GAMM|nr:shikimate dehydrogenase [Ostreibacterium oceani]MPV86879.1 shikimate dehydrogenase [Ostreibacterium oceani]